LVYGTTRGYIYRYDADRQQPRSPSWKRRNVLKGIKRLYRVWFGLNWKHSSLENFDYVVDKYGGKMDIITGRRV
jgi:hypothetical protein